MPATVGVRLQLEGGKAVEGQLASLGRNGQRALSRIERGARPASRGLLAVNRASAEVGRGLAGLAAQAGSIGAALSALGPAGVAATAAMVVGFTGVIGVVHRTLRAIEQLDVLDDTARKVGVTAEALQELRFAGEQVGVGARTTDMALQRFSRRVGEVAQGTGEAKGVVEQYGIAVRNTDGTMRSNIDILKDFADVIRDAESDQEALRIGFKLFDSEGAAFALALRNGADALDATMRKAREAGAVIDEELVKRGAAAKDELAAMSRVIDAQLAAAFVDLGPILVDAATLFARIATAVADVVDSFRDLENMTTRGLQSRLADLRSDIARDEGLLEKQRNPLGRAPIQSRLAENRREATRIAGELEARALAAFTSAPTVGAGGGTPSGTFADTETLPKSITGLTATERSIREQRARAREAFRGPNPFDAAEKAEKAAEREAEAVARARARRQIEESHLRSTGQIVELIRRQRDEQLAAIDRLATTEEEKARLRVQVHETANREIAAAAERANREIGDSAGELSRVVDGVMG